MNVVLQAGSLLAIFERKLGSPPHMQLANRRRQRDTCPLLAWGGLLSRIYKHAKFGVKVSKVNSFIGEGGWVNT